MNLFKLAPALEQFAAAAGETSVTLDGSRCVRHWNQGNACRRCAEGCPATAIAVTPAALSFMLPPASSAATACMPVRPELLPAGTKRRSCCSPVAALTSCAALDLTCSHFPAEQTGNGVDAIIQVSGCLAATGCGCLCGAGRAGRWRVGVHLAACAGCPIGALRAQITSVAAESTLLTSMAVSSYESVPADQARKPVHATRAPQYSRRSLLRRVMGNAPPAARGLPPLEEPAPGCKSPPLQRRTLLHVLAQLPDNQRTPAAYFPSFVAAASCTACKVCATVCPTGALSLNKHATPSPCALRRLPVRSAAFARNSALLTPCSPLRPCPTRKATPLSWSPAN